MKNKLYVLLPLMVFTMLFFSCISSEDENEGSPTCVITSFSVGDIVSSYSTKTINGKDTTFNRTISGKKIYFNIDQVQGRISSVDSLANWVNIKRVVPTVTSVGTVYYREMGSSDSFNYLRSGVDSLDFSKGIELKVFSTDGNYSRNYVVTLYKSEYETETLDWYPVVSNLSLTGEHRTLSKNGRLYVFAENGGTPTLSVGTTGINQVNWTSPSELSSWVDYKSVTLFGGQFYALDAEGKVNVSTDGLSWSLCGSTVLDRLLMSDSFRLYGSTGTTVVTTTDGATWTEEPSADLSSLPEMPVSGVAYAMNTNKSMQTAVMLGRNNSVSTTPVWFKVSSSNEDSDQPWNYINISGDNNYPLPSFNDVQMVRYEDVLIAMGRGGDQLGYQDIYVSADNGVTWHVQESVYGMISALKGTTSPVTMAVCSNSLYVIQSGGKVWRGVK